MDKKTYIAKAISNCRSQWSEAPDQPISQTAHFFRAHLYEGRVVFGQGTEVHQIMGRVLSFKQKTLRPYSYPHHHPLFEGLRREKVTYLFLSQIRKFMIFAGKDGGNKETGGEDLLKVQLGKLEQFEIRTYNF